MTFTTAAFDRSSSWQFEASSYTATPKGHPSSLLQHDACASSWHNHLNLDQIAFTSRNDWQHRIPRESISLPIRKS
jgi:hypothetical protein